MENKNAFKNLINSATVKKISFEIKNIYSDFDEKNFLLVSDELTKLELRARAIAIAKKIHELLPGNYNKSIKILEKVVRRQKLKGFELWPISEFISTHGVEYFDLSLEAMYHLTQVFTSEFAVRPFFIADHKRVLKKFHQWTQDKSAHVRRLVSEGSRPLLPWGLRLDIFKEQPELTIALLEKLKYDDELYVRKSVANHLNDITKFNPELVIKTIKQWEQSCPEKHRSKIQWIKKHALRTLIKKGIPEALKLMGIAGKAKIKLVNFKTDKKIYKTNQTLIFELTIKSLSKTKQRILIDYVIYFLKSNGKTSPKVFKFKTLDLLPSQSLKLVKAHSLRPITTMKFYKGEQHISVKINGEETKKIAWDLLT